MCGSIVTYVVMYDDVLMYKFAQDKIYLGFAVIVTIVLHFQVDY